jgi:hypothetical protein
MLNEAREHNATDTVWKESCKWTCSVCDAKNEEFSPFPMVAICSGCQREVAKYCSHPAHPKS